VWEAVAGGPYTVPFDLSIWLSTTIQTGRVTPINIDTTQSSYNWITIKRVG